MSSNSPRSGRRSFREYLSRRRDRAHDEAQLAMESHDLLAGTPAEAQVMDHPLVCADEPTMITTDEALAELCSQLKTAGAFAYDTEFIGETSYYPRLLF